MIENIVFVCWRFAAVKRETEIDFWIFFSNFIVLSKLHKITQADYIKVRQIWLFLFENDSTFSKNSISSSFISLTIRDI